MDKLQEIYYNPDTGFRDLKTLTALAKKENIELTNKEIKQWYDSQNVTQLYKQPKQNFTKIVCPFNSVGCLFADLMSIEKFFRQNQGFHFIFVCIDTFSRYAWAYPIKKKEAKETKKAVENVITEIKQHYPNNILTMTVDKGSEFMGEFKKYLEDNDIRIYYNDPNSVSAKTKMVRGRPAAPAAGSRGWRSCER